MDDPAQRVANAKTISPATTRSTPSPLYVSIHVQKTHDANLQDPARSCFEKADVCLCTFENPELLIARVKRPIR